MRKHRFQPWSFNAAGVIVDDLVFFSANNGIQLWEWTSFTNLGEIPRWREIARIIEEHQGIEPDRLCAALEAAITYWQHPVVGEILSNHKTGVRFDEFLKMVHQFEHRAATRAAKRTHMRVRRKEFASSRSNLVLAMIDAGVPYVCAHKGCKQVENLTIDHKLALSRGGKDELDNLQFMCFAHNSAKGDR